MTGVDAVALALSRHPTFAALGDEGCRRCAQLMRRQSLDAGRTLFLRGDRGGALYLVLTGRLRLAVNSQEGRELSVRLVGPGEILGELAAIDQGPRTADATAVQATEIAALSSSALRSLIDNHPEFSFALMRFLCERVRDTTEQLESIALYSVEVRLARFLLVSLDSLGETAALELGVSQSELAQLLGASRPKVNVAFGKLETQGAVRREAGRLTCDRIALARIAGAEGLET